MLKQKFEELRKVGKIERCQLFFIFWWKIYVTNTIIFQSAYFRNTKFFIILLTLQKINDWTLYSQPHFMKSFDKFNSFEHQPPKISSRYINLSDFSTVLYFLHFISDNNQILSFRFDCHKHLLDPHLFFLFYLKLFHYCMKNHHFVYLYKLSTVFAVVRMKICYFIDDGSFAEAFEGSVDGVASYFFGVAH